MAKSLAVPAARKGMPSPKLRKAEFLARYLEQFRDEGFDAVRGELDGIAAIAWEAYRDERKSPQTRKAGKGFADPDYDLSIDWLAATGPHDWQQPQLVTAAAWARRTSEVCG